MCGVWEGVGPPSRRRSCRMMSSTVLLPVVLLASFLGSSDAGIPGLGHFLTQTFPAAMTRDPIRVKTGGRGGGSKDVYSKYNEPLPPRFDDVDCLCVDMNEVVHSSVHGGDSPAKYCHDMYRKIDRLITRFRPRRAVVLSFDGPAPFAKLQHQRAHRAADLDSCAITPGTTFMNAIDSGEGELKLINWINEFVLSEKSARGAGKIVVCGGDSDLILQCMLSGAIDRLRICQDCRGQKRFEGSKYLLWNVPRLVDLILKPLPSGSESNFHPSSTSNDSPANENILFPLFRRDGRTPGSASASSSSSSAPSYVSSAHPASLESRLDIAMIFLFQGNDYLPKLRGTDANLTRTLAAYRKFQSSSLTTGQGAAPRTVLRMSGAGQCGFDFRNLESLLFAMCGGVEAVDTRPAEDQRPCALSMLHEACQQRHLPLKVIEWSDVESAEGNWKSTLRFNRTDNTTDTDASTGAGGGEGLTATGEASSKRGARALAAEPVLMQCFPDAYKKLMMKRIQHDMHSGTLTGDQVNRLFGWIAEQRAFKVFNTNTSMRKERETKQNREILSELEGGEAFDAECSDIDYAYDGPEDPAAILDEAALEEEDDATDIHPSYDEEEEDQQSGEEGDDEGEGEGQGVWADLGSIGAEALASLRLLPSAAASRAPSEEDVEHYLRGLLWTLQMYVTGSCPDASYSYFGRPGVTVYQLWKYINQSSATKLSNAIKVPYSKHRSLSPEAVCAAVLPLSESVAVEMPPGLRSRWAALQRDLAPDSFHPIQELQELYNSSYDSSSSKSSSKSDDQELRSWTKLVNYSSIIGSIQEHWNAPDESSAFQNASTVPRRQRRSAVSLFSRNHPHEPCEWMALTTNAPQTYVVAKGSPRRRNQGSSSSVNVITKAWPVLSLYNTTSRSPRSRLSILERPVPWPFAKLPFKSRMARLRYAPSIRSFDIRPWRNNVLLRPRGRSQESAQSSSIDPVPSAAAPKPSMKAGAASSSMGKASKKREPLATKSASP